MPDSVATLVQTLPKSVEREKDLSSAEQQGATSINRKTVVLKMAQAKARIWPCVACLFQVRSTAVPINTGATYSTRQRLCLSRTQRDHVHSREAPPPLLQRHNLPLSLSLAVSLAPPLV